MTWMDAVLLKIHLGTTDQIHGEIAFDWLIQAAKRSGLRGATVTQGSMGLWARRGTAPRGPLFTSPRTSQ